MASATESARSSEAPWLESHCEEVERFSCYPISRVERSTCLAGLDTSPEFKRQLGPVTRVDMISSLLAWSNRGNPLFDILGRTSDVVEKTGEEEGLGVIIDVFG